MRAIVRQRSTFIHTLYIMARTTNLPSQPLPSIKTSLKFATFRSEIFVAVSRLTSFLFTTFKFGHLTVFKVLSLGNSGPRQKLKNPWKCLSLARRKPASKIIF